ncbi:MAG: TIGR03118 family protein [Chloroflexi bacterium]|nr:MAG: TIGR03118 family protein [Chloroflexota bacterium]TMF36695.1 MAG: TIGR03118 family protein [Chloroflexota bacterium]
MGVRLTRAAIGLLTMMLVVAQAIPAEAGVFRGAFLQANLVSNIQGLALVTDPNLKNPWGLSASSSSPIWVSDNGASVSTLYTGAGTKLGLTVAIPAPGDALTGPFTGTPTGTVFNGTGDFAVSSGGVSGPARFLFATEDGTILGWNPTVKPATAVIAADRSTAVDGAGDVGAVYKGLTNGSVATMTGTANYLYATNFRFGTVDVFDTHFTLQNLGAGAFTDGSLPSGFAPFGIQNIGGLIYVTYAKQDPTKHDDVSGVGNGFVDIYRTDGTFVRRFASGGTLNSPWGLAQAPSTFGAFHNAILVGNFGDGLINGYTIEGRFRGQLKRDSNEPVQNDGLWALRFGNGGSGGLTSELFFTAGLDDEVNGLFGKITAAPDSD